MTSSKCEVKTNAGNGNFRRPSKLGLRMTQFGLLPTTMLNLAVCKKLLFVFVNSSSIRMSIETKGTIMQSPRRIRQIIEQLRFCGSVDIPLKILYSVVLITVMTCLLYIKIRVSWSLEIVPFTCTRYLWNNKFRMAIDRVVFRFFNSNSGLNLPKLLLN